MGKFKQLLLVAIVTAGGWGSCSEQQTVPNVEKHFESESRAKLDSVAMPGLVSPFRWYTAGGRLVMLDIQADPVVHLFTLPNMDTLCVFGRQGKGPGEYLLPGLIENVADDRVALYETNPNRVQYYRLREDSVEAETATQFPQWIADRAIAKAYSSVWQVDEKRAIGLAFPSSFPEADLIDLASVAYVDSLDFVSRQFKQESEPASLYLCQGDYAAGYFALGYRYIDRLEVYRVDRDGFTPLYVVGEQLDPKQTALYDAERDDEMMLYYTDVALVRGRLFALRQQVPEGERGECKTVLEIYDVKSGKGLRRVELGRPIDRCVVDPVTGILYGYDPFCEVPQLYVCGPEY